MLSVSADRANSPHSLSMCVTANRSQILHINNIKMFQNTFNNHWTFVIQNTCADPSIKLSIVQAYVRSQYLHFGYFQYPLFPWDIRVFANDEYFKRVRPKAKCVLDAGLETDTDNEDVPKLGQFIKSWTKVLRRTGIVSNFVRLFFSLRAEKWCIEFAPFVL